MNATKSLEIIYELSQTAVGQEDAKKTLGGIICAVINQIEAADLPVTEEHISNKLDVIAHQFLMAARNQSA